MATSLVVREDALTLYGFAGEDERNTFELLQTASGVGPRLALAMLAVFSPDALRRAVAAEDLAALTTVPGIGRKGAQRIVLELAGPARRARRAAVRRGLAAPASRARPAPWREQVRAGLVNLGWQARDAEQAIAAVEPELLGAATGSAATGSARRRRRHAADGGGRGGRGGRAARGAAGAGARVTGPASAASPVSATAGPTGEPPGDRQERVVSPLADADDRVIEGALRPRRLAEFVGQARVREQLSLVLESALRRGRAPDHVLLSGPPGLGKTTIAMIIAAELGTPLRITSGPAIERAGDLAAMLSTLSEGEVMFIDEIHRVARPAEEMLYLAMEDFRVDVVIGKGPGATSIPLDIAPFTLVGATTRAGLLPAPLRDRFGFTAHLDFYEPEELGVIVRRSAGLLGVALRDDGADEIAGRSRGTPRIANRLLRRVRDFAEVRGDGVITRQVARAALELYEVDESGLDRLDRAVLARWSAGSAAARSACPRWRSRWARRRRPSRWSPSRSWSGRADGPDAARPGGDAGGLGAPRPPRTRRRAARRHEPRSRARCSASPAARQASADWLRARVDGHDHAGDAVACWCVASAPLHFGSWS